MVAVTSCMEGIKKHNDTMKAKVKERLLKIYFLNRRKNIMKQIKHHLQLLKTLKDTIPVSRNLIESGHDFDTGMKLMDHAFTIIDQKLAPLMVANDLKRKLTEAEFRSKKKIEEEF